MQNESQETQRYRRGDPSPVDTSLVFIGYERGKEKWGDLQALERRREKGRSDTIKYRSTVAYKAYRKAYNRKPEVVLKRSLFQKTEKFKEYSKRKKQTPEYKLKSKIYAADRYLKKKSEIRKYERDRLKSPLLRIEKNHRSRIRSAMRAVSTQKLGRASVLLGCDIQFFKNWIESKWKTGMTWENWGSKWEIDHIIPVRAFDLASLPGQLQCFRFSNTQPLWKSENHAKSDRMPCGNFARRLIPKPI